MDWRFEPVAPVCTALDPQTAAVQLAEHWAAQLSPVAALNELLNSGLSQLYIPPALAAAEANLGQVGLQLVLCDPPTCIGLVCSRRRRGGLAKEVWTTLAPYVVGVPALSAALSIARPDIQQFVAKVSMMAAMAGMPASWAADATAGPWEVVIGSRFHADALLCSRILEIPFVSTASNASLALYDDFGVRCTHRDKVVLLLILFFGEHRYWRSLPEIAPDQLRTAQTAPWLAALSSSSATPSTGTPPMCSTPA